MLKMAEWSSDEKLCYVLTKSKKATKVYNDKKKLSGLNIASIVFSSF